MTACAAPHRSRAGRRNRSTRTAGSHPQASCRSVQMGRSLAAAFPSLGSYSRSRIRHRALERIPIVKATERARRIPLIASLLTAGAVLVAAGGFVHLREWLEIYRHVPAAAHGSAVVRVGFPINAAASLLVSVTLAICAMATIKVRAQVVVVAVLLQVGALAALIASRTGSLFGWAEPSWTVGAKQAFAIEIGALLSVAAAAVVAAPQRRKRDKASWSPARRPSVSMAGST